MSVIPNPPYWNRQGPWAAVLHCNFTTLTILYELSTIAKIEYYTCIRHAFVMSTLTKLRQV